jgi:hypothetical protein
MTDEAEIRIDETKGTGKARFLPGESAFLRYDLDFGGRPFLDDEGGGWISGEGPGWVLHYRLSGDTDEEDPRQEFFSGIPLVETDAARAAAAEFLTTVETS